MVITAVTEDTTSCHRTYGLIQDYTVGNACRFLWMGNGYRQEWKWMLPRTGIWWAHRIVVIWNIFVQGYNWAQTYRPKEGKDFNAMLHDNKDMPKFQIITDEKSIEKYGGNRMYFAPPIAYDEVMKKIPYGKVITVGKIREFFAKENGADFTEPITAGIFVSIAAWASYQRLEDKTPYWRTLKANGELNEKYPGGTRKQKEKLEAEGHIIIQKGRKNIRYYVKDYEDFLFEMD